jgi:CheY-like chemotaxis protein
MATAQILVVEDEAIVAVDIQNTLKRLGYEVPAIAFSGEEALKKAEELHPDLVVMNIEIRGAMDGIAAAQKIRDQFNIPVVYLTAYMDEERLKRAQATAPFSYVIKPFEERELHSTIERALKETKMES